MKRSKQAVLLVKPVCFILLSVALAVCAGLLPRYVRQKGVRIQSDIHTVDTFLQNPWGNTFVNQAAFSALEQKTSARQTESDVFGTYLSPEGITFVSKSSAWDQNKLKALYQELLLNQHGEELYRLSQITVYPQEDEFAAATHQNESQQVLFSLPFPALPESFGVTFRRETGVISLYNGDRLTTVASMADSLSHEYGHHYTFYHMFGGNAGWNSCLNSKYAGLRGLDETKVLNDFSDTQYYYDNHHWYLIEIAAEDYVTLMGSPNSREITDYYDVREALYGAEGDQPAARNEMVQENLMIPMASEVEGLADYFYSFLGRAAPSFPQKKSMDIQVEKQTPRYYLETGYQTYVSYRFSWKKAYGEDAVYTLVCFEEGDYRNTLYPVKTVKRGEEASAVVGRVARDRGDSVEWVDDEKASGTKTFVVTAVLPDGTLMKSDPFRYTFS